MTAVKFLTDINRIHVWLSRHMKINTQTYDIRQHSSMVKVQSDGQVFINEGDAQFGMSNDQIAVNFVYAAGDFFIGYVNYLKTLHGCPRTVMGNFHCTQAGYLESLSGGPAYVGGLYTLKGDMYRPLKLTSLVGIAKTIQDGLLQLDYNKNMGLMSVFRVKNLHTVSFRGGGPPLTVADRQLVERIINRYLSMGTAGMIPCAAELIKAGYKENARF